MAVMIGVDPHKASHTAVAISPAEVPLGQLRVRASAVQAERLLGWAQAWPERTWAVEGAGGLGHLLARQLLAAGERVLDVPPKLAARVRLLATGDINKNDPGDARSVAVAALRSAQVREAPQDDHTAVLKVWSLCRYRHKDHYSDTAVMPIPAAQVLAGGGGRARDIGIISCAAREAVFFGNRRGQRDGWSSWGSRGGPARAVCAGVRRGAGPPGVSERPGAKASAAGDAVERVAG
ncbi:MAG TPA: transposase [Streptosporangiaceae bacterium]|nr:transposase [Streptosporangiaceae bacterium]